MVVASAQFRREGSVRESRVFAAREPEAADIQSWSVADDWRRSWRKRAEVAAIASIGYPVISALGRTLRWRVEGLEHLDAILGSGRQPVMGFWHGRILPATVYFRRRGIVVITSENFDGEWIARIIERFGYGTARGSTSRGAVKAMLKLKRDIGQGRPAGFTLDGPRGSRTCRAARRHLAGTRDRQPDSSVSPGGVQPLDDEELGSDANPEAVQHRRVGGRGTAGGAGGDAGRRAGGRAPRARGPAARARAAGARHACAGRVGRVGIRQLTSLAPPAPLA